MVKFSIYLNRRVFVLFYLVLTALFPLCISSVLLVKTELVLETVFFFVFCCFFFVFFLYIKALILLIQLLYRKNKLTLPFHKKESKGNILWGMLIHVCRYFWGVWLIYPIFFGVWLIYRIFWE